MVPQSAGTALYDSQMGSFRGVVPPGTAPFSQMGMIRGVVPRSPGAAPYSQVVLLLWALGGG